MEKLKKTINGKCRCGEIVLAITNSSRICRDKIKYCYPEQVNDPTEIYRCRNCEKCISETFVSNNLN